MQIMHIIKKAINIPFTSVHFWLIRWSASACVIEYTLYEMKGLAKVELMESNGTMMEALQKMWTLYEVNCAAADRLLQ